MIDLHTELKGCYEIISDAENLKIKLNPTESWSYFHGHFPAFAILPAVGIIDISQYFIETYIQREKINLSRISFFKIKTPVFPGPVFLLNIQKEGPKKFQVVWKNETENSLCAEFTLELA